MDLGGVEPPALHIQHAQAGTYPQAHGPVDSLPSGASCWPFVFIYITNHNTHVMASTSGNNNAHVIILPPWPIYCFLTQRGENIIREWLDAERVTKTQVAIFQAKIDAFERGGPELNPGLIVGPVAKNIHKMKIKGHKGHVQLRPMVCYGPFGEAEVTLLFGAIEKDSKLRPETCKERAHDNRETLIADPRRRRRERVA